MNRLQKIIKKPSIMLYYLDRLGIIRIDDKKYLELEYWNFFNKMPDLDNPKTYNEKLNYLKLHDRKPIYHKMVDKYEAKKYIQDLVGEEYIIPTYGVYDSFDEIDFDKLPDQFVLKCTHNSGCFLVCKDKNKIDKEKARKMFKKALRKSYYYDNREWSYKDVKPRIIAEKYIDSLEKPDSIEYKLTCCDGVVKLITICKGIAHDSLDVRTNEFYDRDLNFLPFHVFYKNPKEPTPIISDIMKIVEFAEKVSKDVPCLRVDCYYIDNHIYFGEMTFYTWAGFCEFTPPEWDEKLGEYITFKNVKDMQK